MRSLKVTVFVLACAGAALAVVASRRPADRRAPQTAPRTGADWGRLPLAFETNLGQHDPRAAFVARGGGGAVFLTASGARFALAGSRPADADPARHPARRERKAPPLAARSFEVTFPGAREVEPVAEQELPGKANYFIGDDPAKWRTDVPTFTKVRYRGAYPGIDVVFYGNGRHVEYDFEVAPGADPGQVRIAFGHVDGLTVDGAGDLHLAVGGREVVQRRPRVYQDVAGERREVGSAYALGPAGEVAVKLAAYDRRRAVVIDPVLLYSTYLGATGSDEATGIAVDTAGNTCVTGFTTSTNFPLASAYRSFNAGTSDVFVTKIAPSGASLVYSTYLGGAGGDYGTAIAVDGSGSAYVTGSTNSTDFPTANAFQATHGADTTGSDAFVTKLAANGALVYSTYLGGSAYDHGSGIAVSGTGNAYVTGTTVSTNFPTASAYRASLVGPSDAFVTKLATDGHSLVYSTYLGGSSTEDGMGVAVDGSGYAYVVGTTWSSDFPTALAYQAGNAGVPDAFVTKLATNGASLVFSTYLGGSDADGSAGVAVDGFGNVYVTGYACSLNFPTVNAFQATVALKGEWGTYYDEFDCYDGCPVWDPYPYAFVTKLAASGASLAYSTFLGGSAQDSGAGIAVDGSGNAYVAGQTSSSDFPTANPYQAANSGNYDAFLTRLAANGASLAYSTYIGGTGTDLARAVALDGAGNAYVTGYTTSTDLPTASPFQAAKGTGDDGFVLKLSPLFGGGLTPASGPTAGGTTVTISGDGFVAGMTVLFGTTPAASVTFVSATSLTAVTPAHAAGTVTVSLQSPVGGSVTVSSTFTFVPPPVVTSVSPIGGPPAGGTIVTLTGTGLTPATQVKLDGTNATSVTYDSATSIRATTPGHASGAVDVVVENADGQKTTFAGGFTYAPAPTVATVAPIGGPPAGGTFVTITGTGFRAGATVTLGGASATGVAVADSTTITATTSAHALGPVAVVVSNTDGQSGTLADGYTYAPPPVVSVVTPTSGPTTGSTVFVTGVNFVSGATVTFGGVAGTGIVVNNSTSITVTTPAHAAGAVNVTVRNPDTQASTLAAGFTYTGSGGGPGPTPTSDPAASTAGSKDFFAASCSHAGAGGWLSLGLVALLLRRRRRRVPAALVLVACLVPSLALAQAVRPAPAARPPASSVQIPLPPPPTTRKPSAKKDRVALLPVRTGIGIDPKLAEAASDPLAAALGRRGVSVVSFRDIEAALGFERQRQLLGCSSDSSCLAEIGGALGVERVVSSALARFGGTLVFTAQLLDSRSGSVLRRTEQRMKADEQLLVAVDRVALDLFPAATPPEAQAGGAPAPTPHADETQPAMHGAGWGIGIRGSGSVTALGGAAAMLVEYRSSSALSISLGPAVTASGIPGALARLAWTPIQLGRRTGIVLAAEGIGYFDGGSTVAGAAGSAGLEVALSRRFAIALEVPALFLVSAPAEYRKVYVTPGVTMGWTF